VLLAGAAVCCVAAAAADLLQPLPLYTLLDAPKVSTWVCNVAPVMV